MSFHFLIEAEQCPRSTALSRGIYPDLWNKNGYPRKPHLAALSGRITHIVVSRIALELARRGCASLCEAKAVQILKELGGYTKVIVQSTDALLNSLVGNPRFEAVRQHTTSRLRAQVSQIREQVQVLMSRLSLQENALSPPIRDKPTMPSSNAPAVTRKPLGLGAHFEVELRDEQLRWKGIADMLCIGDDGCTITDFKTGERFDDHELQLRIYALLWARDNELNPSGRPATSLVLSYPHGEHEVTHLDSVLEESALATDLRTRTAAVRQALQSPEPKANVSEENCRTCEVRHLCNEYWSAIGPKSVDTSARAGHSGIPELFSERRDQWLAKTASKTATKQTLFDDIEVILQRRRTDITWEAECWASTVLQPRSRILLRLPVTAASFGDQFQPGDRIRLTDALLAAPEPGGLPLVQALANTELLLSSIDGADA
jgi:hypothetical protein